MKLFDTHCHVHFNAYKDDAAEVIQRAFDNNVAMITVGTQQDTSKSAVKWAEKYKKGLYAAIGLHPTHSVAHGFNDSQELDFKPRQETFDTEFYQKLVDSSDKVVAIGETGLDYYRLPKGQEEAMKKLQYEAFMAQAEFAAKNELPLIVHCREAYHDQIEAIKEAKAQWGGKKGVVHCFTGTYEEAKLFLDQGWYVAFTGIAVFANAVGDVAKKVPLDMMLIETDAPYLTPPPYRGKRNEPIHVKYVAQDIAQRKGITTEEVAAATYANSLKLFNIKE